LSTLDKVLIIKILQKRLNYCIQQIMKNLTLLLFINMMLFSVALPVNAQKKSSEEKTVYDFWIKDQANRYSFKGYLSDIKESSLVLSSGIPDIEPIEIAVSDIKVIYFRPKGRLKKRMILGAALGIGTGLATIIIANLRQDCINCFYPEEYLASGLFFGAVGAGVGFFSAYKRVIIRIDGNQKNYREQKEQLLKYQYDF